LAEEISKYMLDLVRVQEVRWDRGGTEPAGKYTFFYGKGNGNHELGTVFFVHKRITAVKRVEFVSDRIPYIILRGWCDIVVLNVHAPIEDTIDDVTCYHNGHRCATDTVTNRSDEVTLSNNGSDETRYHYL
jgi:hypothetical protein